MSLVDCSLCSAVCDAKSMAGRPSLQNTPIAETDRFVVMPCVGPLVPGHVLVVSREHYPSLASMGREAIRDYQRLLDRFREANPSAVDGLLEAEHGAVSGDCAGACVVHTHIHWMPGLGRYDTLFEGVLAHRPMGESLGDLAGVDTPYLLVRRAGGAPHLYDGSGLPSQLIRQAICSQLGREDWDWRSNPRMDWINLSIDIWKRGS